MAGQGEVIVGDTAHAVDAARVTIVRSYSGELIKGLNAARLLGVMGRFLPPGRRARFVAEALGDLGSCEDQRARTGNLLGLVIGMPRLAWVMRHEGRFRWWL